MIKLSLNNLALKLLLFVLILPEISDAQNFTDTENGDVVAGFRKTGQYQEQSEMVAYLGNITNFLQVPAGTTINITNYMTQQLTNMCPDNFGNLQWSVFSSFENDTLQTSVGTYPNPTCWYTVARTNVNDQTKPFLREDPNTENAVSARMVGVSDGANDLSQFLGTSNLDNNPFVLLEPYSDSATMDLLDDFISGRINPNKGTFYDWLSFSVENVTSNNFSTPSVSDFCQDVPISTSAGGTYTDPITGQTNGSVYFVGRFTLNPNGSMTFTRASATAPVPVAGFSGTPTNDFAPMQVVFTDASTGTITNWLWNLGDGTSVTNTSNASVDHTYVSSGRYTVSLTVTGPGGANTSSKTSYIVVSAKPTISSVTLTNGGFVINGMNCPAGVQYRILTSTNLTLPSAEWKTLVTSTFASTGSFSYTNATTNAISFFQLVSP